MEQDSGNLSKTSTTSSYNLPGFDMSKFKIVQNSTIVPLMTFYTLQPLLGGSLLIQVRGSNPLLAEGYLVGLKVWGELQAHSGPTPDPLPKNPPPTLDFDPKKALFIRLALYSAPGTPVSDFRIILDPTITEVGQVHIYDIDACLFCEMKLHYIGSPSDSAISGRLMGGTDGRGWFTVSTPPPNTDNSDEASALDVKRPDTFQAQVTGQKNSVYSIDLSGHSIIPRTVGPAGIPDGIVN